MTHRKQHFCYSRLSPCSFFFFNNPTNVSLFQLFDLGGDVPLPCRCRSCWRLVAAVLLPGSEVRGTVQLRAGRWPHPERGFIAGAWGCLVPPRAQSLPSACASINVCLCMCVVRPICHNHRAQIKMRQLLGGILWNGMEGCGGVGGNLRGGGWRDSQHSFRLEPGTNRTLEILHDKAGRVQRVFGTREKIFTGRIINPTRPF